MGHRKSATEVLAHQIDALLPQTQCRQCGYPGCRPYAEAVATGRAGINRCPPGGEETIARLASLLGKSPEALDPTLTPDPGPREAHIAASACIGCLKCVRACPVDAILGAAGQLHVVLSEYCTGCGLCIPPCPVDCIDLRPRDAGLHLSADHARARFLARNARLAREKDTRNQHRDTAPAGAGTAEKRAYISDAVKRAQAKRRSARNRDGNE